jgi:DNA-binding SARP family transcriptional activator
VTRLQSNQTKAKVLHDWFVERGLRHGGNVAKLYFPDLGIEASTPVTEPPALTVLDTMRIDNEPVKGRKRQELLLGLLEARVLGQPETTTLVLLDRLYPNQAEPEAQTALRQLVFKTRAAHGVNTILTTPNGYALGELGSDLERFLRTPNLELWRVAYPLFGSLEVRDTLHQTVLRHAQALLEIAPSQVVNAMRLLLESDPYDVAAIGLACQALQKLGNPNVLKRFYTTQKARLLEVGEVLPENWNDLMEVSLLEHRF